MKTGVLLVKVVPGASRNRVVGMLGDALKVQVSAPPEGGKANVAVARLLADFFGASPAQVELMAGAGNPRKQFRINGVDQSDIDAKLAEFS